MNSTADKFNRSRSGLLILVVGEAKPSQWEDTVATFSRLVQNNVHVLTLSLSADANKELLVYSRHSSNFFDQDSQDGWVSVPASNVAVQFLRPSGAAPEEVRQGGEARHSRPAHHNLVPARQQQCRV